MLISYKEHFHGHTKNNKCRMTAGYDEKQNKISIIKKELTGTRYSVT